MTEPRKSRAYHISQDAIDICNRLNLDPSEAILYLNAEVEKRSAFIDVKKAMREVMQVEGVTLRATDKEMLEKCFSLVISEIQKAKEVKKVPSWSKGDPDLWDEKDRVNHP